MRKPIAAALTALLLAGGGLAATAPAFATPPEGTGNDPVSICHSGDGVNFTYIAPDGSGAANGHEQHDADQFGLSEADCLALNPVPEPEPDPVPVDVDYVTAAWLVPGGPGSIWEPHQTLVTSIETEEPELGALDSYPFAECSYYQIDVYVDNEITDSLLAGGVLYGPSEPPEALIPGGHGTAWKYIETDCPPPAPEVCTTAGDWYTEADDQAPVETIDGLVFQGTATPGLAVGLRHPVTGNLQGFTGASFTATFEGGADFYFRLVVDLSADGGPAYKSLSFPGTTSITPASEPWQYPGQSIADLAVAYPNNVITSAGFQISTNSPTTAKATLHTYSSDCGMGAWGEEPPADETGTEETTGEPVCVEPLDGTATIEVTGRDWTQAWVPNQDRTGYVLGEKVYGEPYLLRTDTVEDEDCSPPPPTEEPEFPAALPLTGSADPFGPMWVAAGILGFGALLLSAGVVIARRQARTE